VNVFKGIKTSGNLVEEKIKNMRHFIGRKISQEKHQRENYENLSLTRN
jgi:hypothetical protein